MLSKFLLIMFLARVLTPSDLGLFGLLSALTTYGLFLVGFDFYTYSSRELLGARRTTWGSRIKAQGSLYLIMYLCTFPIFLCVFIFQALPWSLVPWFFALLVLEHLAQETSRLLVILPSTLTAGLVLFLRAGAWPMIVVPLMWGIPSLRTLDTVFLGWTLSASAACAVGLLAVARSGLGGWREKVDWHWIRKGLVIAIPLLLATLSLRALFSLDRYFVNALAGADILGAYVLFVGIAGVTQSFLDASVVVFLYPPIIEAYKQGNLHLFKDRLRVFASQTVLITTMVSLAALLLTGPLVKYLGKHAYSENMNIFFWLLLAMWMYCVSLVPHYAIYARGADRYIIISHISGLAVFAILVWFLSRWIMALAVPIALAGTFFYLLVFKSVVHLKLGRAEKTNGAFVRLDDARAAS